MSPMPEFVDRPISAFRFDQAFFNISSLPAVVDAIWLYWSLSVFESLYPDSASRIVCSSVLCASARRRIVGTSRDALMPRSLSTPIAPCPWFFSPAMNLTKMSENFDVPHADWTSCAETPATFANRLSSSPPPRMAFCIWVNIRVTTPRESSGATPIDANAPDRPTT